MVVPAGAGLVATSPAQRDWPVRAGLPLSWPARPSRTPFDPQSGKITRRSPSPAHHDPTRRRCLDHPRTRRRSPGRTKRPTTKPRSSYEVRLPYEGTEKLGSPQCILARPAILAPCDDTDVRASSSMSWIWARAAQRPSYCCMDFRKAVEPGSRLVPPWHPQAFAFSSRTSEATPQERGHANFMHIASMSFERI